MTLRELSMGYQHQLQYEPALQLAGEQSLGLCRHIYDSLPEIDHRIGLATAMGTHADNLLEMVSLVNQNHQDVITVDDTDLEYLDGCSTCEDGVVVVTSPSEGEVRTREPALEDRLCALYEDNLRVLTHNADNITQTDEPTSTIEAEDHIQEEVQVVMAQDEEKNPVL
ncbi:hypothetical protein B0H19DRAFT_1248326 [Mycena capillaripes]|nr:hypothetical protein B0H19DRAFT_1248326 [Mycena capillaripes]